MLLPPPNVDGPEIFNLRNAVSEIEYMRLATKTFLEGRTGDELSQAEMRVRLFRLVDHLLQNLLATGCPSVAVCPAGMTR
jgi:hypothetical protein